ncbi:MAG: hypothetical protein LKF99_05820 [Bifidobacterium sp.]|jgi:hypothetical protein|nr:hypothetical protein [Bifidobacterium sp.]
MTRIEQSEDNGRFHLSMRENAYDSLNEALLKSEEASDTNPIPWKYAVLHIAQTLELMFKQRLYDEYPLLLWTKLQPGTHTVTLEESIVRLKYAGIAFDSDDENRLKQTIKWRNAITHYNVDLQIEEIQTCFALLFEFLTRFQTEQYPEEPDLTDHLSPEAKTVAAHVMTFFREDTVLFDGIRMHRTWPAKLTDAQNYPSVNLNEETFNRIAYRREPHWQEHLDWVPRERCHDCSCRIGQLHGPGCCVEECPRCGGQFWFCDCNFDESELWGLTWTDDDLEQDNEAEKDHSGGRYGIYENEPTTENDDSGAKLAEDDKTLTNLAGQPR